MQSSTALINLLTYLFVANIKKIWMNRNCFYYPRPMYPGNYGDTQFCPFLDCFAKPENEAVLAVKSLVRSEWFIYNFNKSSIYLFKMSFLSKQTTCYPWLSSEYRLKCFVVK